MNKPGIQPHQVTVENINRVSAGLGNMNIFNVRFGFANNSSSSHSMVLIPDGNSMMDEDDEDFGWNFFTLASVEAKEEYLACAVLSNLSSFFKSYDYNDNPSKSAIDKIMKSIFSENILENITEKNIDHQSIPMFPLSWGGEGLDIEFIRDYKDFFKNPKLIIVGGNDNDEQEHNVLSINDIVKITDLPVDGDSSGWVARKNNNYWTLFNRVSGNKVRFSFEDFTKKPEKVPVPELVDVKITDFCPYGCSFCYQGSTMQGKHADLEFIKELANEFSKNKVFEVALGGGETTLHPKFLEILKIFKNNGVTPNFTTKNLSWIKGSQASDILETCGSFAYSISSVNDVIKASAIVKEMGDVLPGLGNKITMQYVMGVSDLKEFESIVKTSSFLGAKLSLLGYKSVGRGEEFKPHNYEGWLDIVKKYKKSINIDTALASESKEVFKKSKIPEWLYHVTEGSFSMYVDATKKTMSQSSYMGEIVNFDKNWIENYQKLQPITYKKPKI